MSDYNTDPGYRVAWMKALKMLRAGQGEACVALELTIWNRKHKWKDLIRLGTSVSGYRTGTAGVR